MITILHYQNSFEVKPYSMRLNTGEKFRGDILEQAFRAKIGRSKWPLPEALLHIMDTQAEMRRSATNGLRTIIGEEEQELLERIADMSELEDKEEAELLWLVDGYRRRCTDGKFDFMYALRVFPLTIQNDSLSSPLYDAWTRRGVRNKGSQCLVNQISGVAKKEPVHSLRATHRLSPRWFRRRLGVSNDRPDRRARNVQSFGDLRISPASVDVQRHTLAPFRPGTIRTFLVAPNVSAATAQQNINSLESLQLPLLSGTSYSLHRPARLIYFTMASQAKSEIVLYDLACEKNVCFSPVVWRIRFMLNYKQIPYETVYLEFPDIEPTLTKLGITLGASATKYTVPAIHHLPTDQRIMDSLPIAQFLDSHYPDPPVPLTSELGSAIEVRSRSAIGAAIRVSIMPREVNVLSPRAQDFFRRARESALGHPLEDLLEQEEQTWCAKDEDLRAVGELIRTNKAHGPFVLGDHASYTDFLWMSIMHVDRTCRSRLEVVSDDVHNFTNNDTKCLGFHP
nr:glutathione s-transferase-like protein usts [Quercus suber]